MRLATAIAVAVAGLACARAPEGARCYGGADCAAGLTCCKGLCRNTQSDVVHCAGCGVVCGGSNAAGQCVDGQCYLTCASGYADCDGDTANGCEARLATDALHCGACAHACLAQNAPPLCFASACGHGPCRTGTGDCDGNAANGCETEIRASIANCGACGRACAPPHAVPSCEDRTCTFSSCLAGWGDCNRARADGCEVHVAGDPANCGACGRTCATDQVCAAGDCVPPSLYLVGGSEDGQGGLPTIDVTRFDLNTRGFVPVAVGGPAPPPRAGHCAVHDAPERRIVVWGGRKGTERADAAVWALDLRPSPPVWRKLVSEFFYAPNPRYFAGCAFDPATRRLFVFGGDVYPPFASTLNDVWVLELSYSLPIWRRLHSGAGNAPTPRSGTAATYDANRARLIVFGGVERWGLPLDDLWELDLSGEEATWSAAILFGTDRPQGRFGARFLEGVGAPLLFGGGTPTGYALNDLWALETSPSVSMRLLMADGSLSAPGGRAGYAAAAYDGGSYVFGGRTTAWGTPLADVWAYYPADAAWTRILDDGAADSPKGRYGSAMVPGQ